MTTGSQVINDSSAGSAPAGFGRDILGALAGGVRGWIDLELKTRAASIPDRADVANQVAKPAPPPAAGSLGEIVKSLKPWQLGGLLVAGGLTIALFTGAFR